MKEKLGQWFASFGSLFAAACCLGLPLAISAVTATGLGFILNDALLYPLFTAFLTLSLWLTYRNGSERNDPGPFWVALGGGLLAAFALWFTVTGLSPQSWAVITGLIIFLGAQIWDFMAGQRAATSCASHCETETPVDPERRLMTGAAISIAAAGVFYGLAKSVQKYIPQAEDGEIACWGINSCKGTSECATAFNACKGQNDCKGKGYLYASPEECNRKGGVPLAGSEGDPHNRKT